MPAYSLTNTHFFIISYFWSSPLLCLIFHRISLPIKAIATTVGASGQFSSTAKKIPKKYATRTVKIPIIETKNPVFSMLSSVKCRNSQEINDFSTLSDTLFYPLSQNQKYLQSGFHPNPEGYRKSTVRLDNC